MAVPRHHVISTHHHVNDISATRHTTKSSHCCSDVDASFAYGAALAELLLVVTTTRAANRQGKKSWV